ncbi:hypothetical protein APA23_00105 [Pseudomonas aeruginosa]|nr:hypothetical protein APA23_00105 [Pseudomonas aeruginosa]
MQRARSARLAFRESFEDQARRKGDVEKLIEGKRRQCAEQDLLCFFWRKLKLMMACTCSSLLGLCPQSTASLEGKITWEGMLCQPLLDNLGYSGGAIAIP